MDEIYNGSIICLVSSQLFLIASILNYLFDKHIDNLINVHNNTIDDIIKIYYSEKELLTAKKYYKNNDYIKTLLVPKLFSKFLDAIDKQYIYDLSDAETEVYYTDDDINYNDDNYDD